MTLVSKLFIQAYMQEAIHSAKDNDWPLVFGFDTRRILSLFFAPISLGLSSMMTFLREDLPLQCALCRRVFFGIPLKRHLAVAHAGKGFYLGTTEFNGK